MWTLWVGHEDVAHVDALRGKHAAGGLGLFVAHYRARAEAGVLLGHQTGVGKA
jgi:hypothetical protein